MENMQNFYTRLFSVYDQDNGYWSAIFKLTKLRPEQVASLNTLLWWNNWSAEAR